MGVVFSLAFWGFMLLTSALFFPVAALLRLATSPFDTRLTLLHRFTCFWGSLYSWCNPLWTVTIEGKDNIRAGETYVMVCNHQSLVDILVLFRLFILFKWVSKAENFRIPFVGWNMTLNRYIRIERGSVKGNLMMMRNAEAALSGGSSVILFPEGTRSADGQLHEFKEGAFELARKTGRPILPIVVDGTAAALPKRGFVLRGKQAIRIRVLESVPVERNGTIDAGELALRVRGNIAGALEDMRREAKEIPQDQ